MSDTRKRVGPTGICALIRALIRGPHTLTELAEVADVSKPLVSAWVKEMRSGLPLAYIAEWKADSRGYFTVPAFRWGCEPDAPRPPAKSARQRVSEWRARQGRTA